MNSSDSFTLTPTGERMIPEYLGSIVSEHLHRYAIAQSRAGGLDVLDVASGEGYGSALLADVARSVIGVDIDRVTIEHARAKYVRSNLRFEVGSCTNIPLSAASVDLIVSFETIEHIVEHELFMREIRRVLRPGGLLVISCPDRRVYNETLEKGNPFHQHELYYDEFVSLIKTHFNHAAFGKQQYGEASVIFFSQSTGTMTSVEGNFEKFVSGDFEVSGAYSLAIASDVQLVLPPSSFFRLDASLRHQSPSLTACQLFASGDGIFSEEQSERYSLVLGQKTELRFQNLAKWVTGTRLHLRLDPSEVKSKIILHSITIEDSEREILFYVDPAVPGTEFPGVQSLVQVSSEPNVFYSQGNDPQIVFSPIEIPQDSGWSVRVRITVVEIDAETSTSLSLTSGQNVTSELDGPHSQLDEYQKLHERRFEHLRLLATMRHELESRFLELQSATADAAKRGDSIDERLAGVNERIAKQGSNFSQSYEEMGERLSGLQNSVSEQISALERKLSNSVAELSQKQERLFDAYASLSTQLDRFAFDFGAFIEKTQSEIDNKHAESRLRFDRAENRTAEAVDRVESKIGGAIVRAEMRIAEAQERSGQAQRENVDRIWSAVTSLREDLVKRLAVLEDERTIMAAEKAALERSIIWRMTTPIRKIRDIFTQRK